MTHDLAVLANPAAGRGRHRALLTAVLDRLRAGDRAVRLIRAATGDDAERRCREAVADGIGAVVAVGGDGTVHRALQAVAGTSAALGIVPTGTGNDIAAGTAVPADPLSAADAVARAIGSGTVRRVDLARAVSADGSPRWFAGVLAAGFDALVNERANAMRRPSGPRRYDLAVALELSRLRSRHYTLTLDGVEQAGAGVLVAVGNCASYGGGLRICPAADPTDGLLDVVIGGPMGRVALAMLKPRVRHGTHVRDRRVASYQAREVRVDVAGIVGYADGERLGPLPLVVTCVPGALRLLV